MQIKKSSICCTSRERYFYQKHNNVIIFSMLGVIQRLQLFEQDHRQQTFMSKSAVFFQGVVQKNVTTKHSCGSVALMVLGQFSDICGPQGYGFHPIKNSGNCAVKILRRFFANLCHEIGCENDQTYIFRFVEYLSTFFYTYLPVNIHFQLIIITNVSILTDPAYFVPPSCHCGIIALRSQCFGHS